jgi:hypothetical protein
VVTRGPTLAEGFLGWKARIRRKPGTDMNFGAVCPEIHCSIIYLTTARSPHHKGLPLHPFQEMHAGFGSRELLGDVHQVHVRPICTRPNAVHSDQIIGAKSFRGCASIGEDHPPSGVNRPKPDRRALNFPQRDFLGVWGHLCGMSYLATERTVVQSRATSRLVGSNPCGRLANSLVTKCFTSEVRIPDQTRAPAGSHWLSDCSSG